MKIIIADDEPKICKLIGKLIDWDSLNIEIAAVAHDGIEALTYIGQLKPDIVITDIRMPGYDGLELIRQSQNLSPETEFIIISGYRQFEYAKNAIHYGVKNYLLKPIQKNELLDTITKIQNSYIQKHSPITNEKKYQTLIENNRNQKRAEFLKKILHGHTSSLTGQTPEKINQIFSFHFKDGCFQIAIIKADGLDYNASTESDYIYSKIQAFISNRINKFCYDSVCIAEESFYYILMNYQDIYRKEIRTFLKKFLNELLCQKEVLHHMNVTLGIGSIQNQLALIPASAGIAYLAIEQRLVLGTNMLLDESHIAQTDSAAPAFHEFRKRFCSAIDRLNENEITDSFSWLKKYLSGASGLCGHEIIQFAREVIQLYMVSMQKNNFILPDREQFSQGFQKALDNQSSWQNIISLLSRTILDSYRKSFNAKKQEENKPIREARNYIKANLKSNLSLEQISSIAGFNPSYFSSLFKKETGSTLSEYIVQVRMERAKEFLKETDWNISVICEEVGYNDLKNFNKNFKKYTGLRPNEFRKLYN